MGGKALKSIGRASLALIVIAVGVRAPVLAQSTNLAYQVANLGEDVRILQESIKSMRVQLDSMRRENEQMRRQIGAYESRVDNSMGQLATVGQLNQAIAKAIASLEQRDEKMKSEIILQVTEQITDFAGSVKQSLGSLPSVPAKPDPDVLTSFHDNFPKTGTTYVVRSGDTISGIASKFGSTRDWIQNANQISHPKFLQVGRTLFIPHQ
jgi:LysM repeat protein